jgi:hypothetical protein
MLAVGATFVCVASAAVFWRTAYPTITWWDSSNYSLAAATLGVTSSPGSLLLTLLGWLVTRLPTGLTTARELALFAGVIAAATVTVVYFAALRLARMANGVQPHTPAAVVGVALGALTLAFSSTLWQYATQFTPYVLTAVFTALILLVMLRWWEVADRDDAWRWLALLAFLFGLDFSVHRTNALLLPAVLGWMLIRRPATLSRGSSWIAGVMGMVAGLTLHLAIMPIAAHTRSPLNMFEPSTWARFWDYVSLAQVGGAFLVDLWPRKSGLVSVQVADFLRAAGDNFFAWHSPTYALGWLPVLALLSGLVALWRRSARLGAGVTVLIALHVIMTVLYFNIPASYFRSLDRHYLPVFVTMAIPLAIGMSVIVDGLANVARKVWPRVAAGSALALAGGAVALVPIAQLSSNWAANDASRRFFARDYAVNALEQLPPNAIYVTVGDNDTFPVMYVQSVEGVRPDVQIVNTSLANTRWYIEQIVARDSSFPASATFRRDSVATDSVAIPMADSTGALGAAPLRVFPKPMFGGTRMLPADWVLLDIVIGNAWRRPLTVAITAGHENLGWLQPHARLDGWFWSIVPLPSPTIDRDLVRANLIDRPAYRGYADSTVRLDDVTRNIGTQAYVAGRTLFDAERTTGNIDRCRDAAARFAAKIPLARLELPAKGRREIEPRCDTR